MKIMRSRARAERLFYKFTNLQVYEGRLQNVAASFSDRFTHAV